MISTVVMTVVAFAQLGLAIGAMSSHYNATVFEVHGGFGYASVVVAVVVAVFAWRQSRTSGNRGVFWHALSIPILCIVQLALIGSGYVTAHIILGLVYFVAVIGLFMVVRRRTA